MAKKQSKNATDSTKQQSAAINDIDSGLASISGRHDLIKQQIDAQTASLESQKVAYDSIAKAQQKGVDTDKEATEVKKRLKKEQESLNGAAKETKKAFDAMGESLDQVSASGVPGMRELVNVIKEAKNGGKGLSVALFALGAAAGGIGYNLGLVGDKLGTIAKWDKKIVPLQERLDLLKNSIEGAFAGQEAAGKFGFEMQRMAVSFEKASKTALFGNGIGSVGYGAAQLQLAGISADKIASQMQAASDATGKMPSSKVAADMAVMAARTGQSAEGISSINEMFQRLDGASEDVALNMQEGMRAMADKAGINLGGLMAEMAESSKEMLGYQIKTGAQLAKQVTFARSMGLSFQDIAKAGKNMVLNYQDSIKSEMQLSAMLGRNVDLSEVRAKFASGDQKGALQALKAQGLDPASMDIFQQQMLQQATGMDLSALSKIVKNNGKEGGELAEGNAKKGNQAFLSKTQSASITEAVQNAYISVNEQAFNIAMEARKKMALLESQEYRALQNKIAQTEALKDAEVGLTTALISLISGLATSGLGKMLMGGGLPKFGKLKDSLNMGFAKPKPGEEGNFMFNPTKYAKNAAGRYVDPTTKRFVSNDAVKEAKANGEMGGMTKGAKMTGMAVAGIAGAVQGYSNYDTKRKGEDEVRTTDKMGAGLVQGGLSAAGTALGMAFGGPLGGMIGGFLGDSLGSALNEYAPGLAQGFGDVFTGFAQGWEVLKGKLTALWDTLQPVRDLFGELAQKLGFEEGGMSGILQTVGKALFDYLIWPINIFVGALTGVFKILGSVVKLIKGDFGGAWQDLKDGIAAFFDGLIAPFRSIVAGIWNWVADSKVGQWLGLSRMEVEKPAPKAEVKKAEVAAPDANKGVDTMSAADQAAMQKQYGAGGGVSTAGAGGATNVIMSDAGFKSIVDAMNTSSKWMQDKLVYMSGNVEKVVARTEQTANNTAASLQQLKELNTNTKAMQELTRRIEALTRATYEGGSKVVIDGKVVATAAAKYVDNSQGNNPNSLTEIFRGETTTYGY